MNENKWIDNSRTKIGQCVGAKAQDGKNALNHNNKNNNGRNFQFAKFSFIDFVLTDRRNLPGKRPNRQIFQMSIFVLSREKCHYQSHRIRNFRFFFSYIGFLHLVGKFECHCLYTNWFFSVLAAIIWEDFDKLPWIKNGEGFAVHSSAWPSGAKGEWRSAADWWYQTHVKKYRIITAFLGAGNPCTTP